MAIRTKDPRLLGLILDAHSASIGAGRVNLAAGAVITTSGTITLP